jgi:thiol-disulfide isomerase/thioredoxin
MPPFLLFAALMTLLESPSVLAADSAVEKKAEAKQPAAEDEFVKICMDWQTGAIAWTQENAELTDHNKRVASYEAKLESLGTVQKLIEFEKAHRGTPIGLMAVRRLWHMQIDGARKKGLLFEAGQHALDSLRHYGELDELVEVIRYVDLGRHTGVEAGLRSFINQKENIKEANRDFAKFTLARWALQQRQQRQAVEAWFKGVESGEILEEPSQRDAFEELRDMLVSAERLPDLQKEALAIAAALAESNTKAQQWAVKPVDQHQLIFQLDQEKNAKGVPNVKDMAAGLVFRENHLKIGQPAPDLKVKLVSGDDFSLTAQQGKVVIIQFAFNGCAPCEGMYADFRELTKKYPDKLVILSLMRDPTENDVKRHIAAGNITWQASLDTFPGQLTMDWGVRAFPTIYVYGPDGKLAGEKLSGASLKDKVKELLN